MENMHAERAVDYYSRNFNCTQGVFTTYAIEHVHLFQWRNDLYTDYIKTVRLHI